MAKLTLLDMVQQILNAMDSDEVNSISDTVESAQVATIVKETFFDLMALRDWPFLRTESALTGLADTNNPTKMLIPETINKIFWIKYNKKEVSYLDPKSFKDMIDMRVAGTNVDSNGYVTNLDPVYWTTFDDEYVVFDGYDSSVDSTLQTSKSFVYGVTAPSWTHSDGFIPDLPDKYFPTLLAEAKSACFINLKQQMNNREEMKAKRGRTTMQNEAWRSDDGETKSNSKINYGRK